LERKVPKYYWPVLLSLFAIFVLIGARVIHRRDGTAYRSIVFDCFYFALGGGLVSTAALALYARWSVRDWEPELRGALLDAYLGPTDVIPSSVFAALGVLGVAIFVGRVCVWRRAKRTP